jgi:prepilin-type N-terminal cleavage/methylation domain-containing protein
MSENRKAFTLIELMVVVVIIVMLAMLASTAYFGAMQSAREVRTIGIIAKLDAAISDIYETYEFRFEHIEDALNEDMTKEKSGQVGSSRTRFNNNRASMGDDDLTRLKRKLMYDLMRMEMPSIRKEVEPISKGQNSDGKEIVEGPADIVVAGVEYKLAESAVRQVYYSIISGKSESSFATSSAELLYLIIANLDPEALENFTASEIGDTDNNGLSEFIDGWGRPIAFLRFAPGFTDTDKQPDIKRIAPTLSSRLIANDFKMIEELRGVTPNGAATNAKDLIINRWQDPFDPDMLGDSWFLYPVVVSAGRDGQFGIVAARNASGNPIRLDPPISASDVPVLLFDPFDSLSIGALVGAPDDTSRHNDNIHNHTNFR